ncbi:MAG TPA: anti-sigma factor [Burkholderiales bacterium]|nr:anti-sigma factor [Burkholderiales bacterium]
MKPEETKMLNAYVDGELDPTSCVEMESRLAADPALRAAHEQMRALSLAIREKADYHDAPADLRARIRASAPRDKPSSGARWWLRPGYAFASVAVAAVAVSVALVLQQPSAEDRIAQELLSSHGRATLGGRMFDVASSDRHTVKPWLSSRLPYSPPVVDFAAEGFPLEGGRVDYVGGRAVAVLIYQRRKHVIEAFVWPQAGAEGSASGLKVRGQDGINLESFSRDGMSFWLVSDLDAGELLELAKLLRERG